MTPRELMLAEIPGVVAQFRHAAALAKRAGFDGVEIHGANGYLIDQFLRDGSNRRGDAYGGSVGNRMRLLNEILDAVSEVWPVGRIGVRLTPENSFNDMVDSSPQTHFEYIMQQLGTRGLAYVHMLQGDMSAKSSVVDYHALRACFSGTYIANNGYDLARAKQAIANGEADLVAFGLPFLANPDLVRRYRQGLPLNTADPATFYSGGKPDILIIRSSPAKRRLLPRASEDQ
ncbi:oxidoreductase [Agrobacterium pusense]|uniref:oxidoreductase n=1 Tax=Agrobacterium pusense TaxID=648995 RepID=UPI003FCF7EC3